MASRKSKASSKLRQVTKSRQRSEAQLLRDRQREEKSELKQRQADARARTRALEKTARKRLASIHKAQRKRAFIQRKEVRHRAAVLKRKGLIRPDIDVRKLVPTPQLRNLFKKFGHVLSGKETTFKVPEGMQTELKKQGYTIVNNRIVLQQGQFSRQGKVFTKKPTGAKSSELKTIRLGAQMDAQIRSVFATLKPGEFVGFQVFGHNSYDIYQDADAMIAKIHEYLQRDAPIKNIAILKISDVNKWRAERAAETEELETRRRTKRRDYAKRRRAFKAGLRVTRGH